MPFIRALYFPRLDDTSRQSPPPRLVRLEVILENQTWHADVKRFFNSSEIESFIIDRPASQDSADRRGKSCNICGEKKQNDCACSLLSEISSKELYNVSQEEHAETSYMMTFAALSTADYDDEEPLLERDCDSETEEDCWTRDFLFFKLDGGFPIDIGSSVPGYGNQGSSYATMTRDVEHLQRFFSKLVRDECLVKRRFTPGFQTEIRTMDDSLECRIESMKLNGTEISAQSTPEEQFLNPRELSDSPLRRTQPGNRKSTLVRPQLWRTHRTQSNPPSVQSVGRQIPRATTTLSGLQRRFRISRKYKTAPNLKPPQGPVAGACVGAIRRSWLHFV